MAHIRNTAAMTYKGRIGNTTFYVEGGRQLARVAQNSSNYGETARRSEAQQNRRVSWANLVNFYKASKGWMAKAYETKKRTQSDYNKFMSLNLGQARIYLTKNEAAQGACIVDEFKISEGSLRSINVAKAGDYWQTDIQLKSIKIDSYTTVAEFSRAVIASNNYVHEGMQLTFVSYQQEVTGSNIPSVVCTAYEVTINVNDGHLLRSFLPEFCSQVEFNLLSTSANISVGCFAYIWSETIGGSIRVSTQTLISNNQSLIGRYSSILQQGLAVASYGVDTDVFLATGSNPTLPTPQPNFILDGSINNINVVGGGTYDFSDEASLREFSFRLGNEGIVESVDVRSQRGKVVVLTSDYFSMSGTICNINAAGLTAIKAGFDGSDFPDMVSAVVDGSIYEMEWNVIRPLD